MYGPILGVMLTLAAFLVATDDPHAKPNGSETRSRNSPGSIRSATVSLANHSRLLQTGDSRSITSAARAAVGSPLAARSSSMGVLL